MRGNAELGNLMHLEGADLQFDTLARRPHDGGVQRAVVILLRRRDIVLEAARHDAPAGVDDAQRAIAILGRVDENAEAVNIRKLLKGERLRLHFAENRIGLLLAPLDLEARQSMRDEQFGQLVLDLMDQPLIALPRGATPIDFAYAVHTNVGDTCVGAKINGRMMPLVTRLNNGDEVEIIRSGVQVPPAAWEEIVVTGKARAAIRRATRMAIRKQYSGLGHRILERTFDRAGKAFSREAMKPVLHRLGHKDVEDAIAAVGRGELSSLDVLRAVYPDFKDERVTVKQSSDDGWFNVRSASGMVFRIPDKGRKTDAADAPADGPDGSEPVPIRGLSSKVQVQFSPSGAVPGDRIVGIMEGENTITIYPIQAAALQKFDNEPDRWFDVRWDLDDENKTRFTARILINAINEPGALAVISRVIADLDINIRTLSMMRVATDFTEMAVDVEVWDLRQLGQLLTRLKDQDCVSTARRVYD